MGAVGLRLLSVLPLLATTAAWAHAVDEAADASEAWLVGCLAISIAAYAIGVARLWRRAGRGHGIAAWRAAAFVGGWGVLVLALLSPLDRLGARLFSVHMLQHELLMVVVAPLMVLGRPLAAWAWAMPLPWRRRVGSVFRHAAWRGPWRALTAPLAAWVLHAAALWLWHVPPWFEAALADPVVHTLQHASFLATALLFWWSVLGPSGRAAQGVALVALFTTLLHSSALGALLSLSSSVWYARYGLEDQQLGGLLMWVPGGLVYLGCALVLAGRWISGGLTTADA
ncbi:MAG TPA: cytochrome c oxidase assembly protein [Albitalea sp.]|uniref:cytochrome c oxidase assembly protein n=1 Tax=Piscinibacter sp. TaxID=1903157 RepID=UPI002ED2FBE6